MWNAQIDKLWESKMRKMDALHPNDFVFKWKIEKN